MPRLICHGLLLAALALAGCRPGPDAAVPPQTMAPEAKETVVDVAALRPRVDAFCGNCHDPPPAESFPKDAWRFEVERGFDFYTESFRDDLDPPPLEDVVAYYESLAPDDLHVVPPAAQTTISNPLKFHRLSSGIPGLEAPAVSFIKSIQLSPESDPQLLFCDMRSGEVRTLSPVGVAAQRGPDFQSGTDTTSTLLATCAFPAHLAPCDLDGDGHQELVVAELGSTNSGDHTRGAVIWLRPVTMGWQPRLLASGLGRVADVRPADFDGDGDTDLLVAEFGHFRTGRILLLENTGLVDGVPDFRLRVIDERHGTIHVPVADLNGDGHLDFVALISQEHEVVEAFINDGHADFHRKTIFRGGDPAYGSSGIQLVDVDSDGDLDVLYSNGDTFGSQYLKAYHGIHWLENRGQYPFEDRLLTNMVGVQKALAGDLDGDGDHDIVAVALLPRNLLISPELQQHDSVIVLEQTTPGEFHRQTIERGNFYHAGLELADLDRDGDLDIVIGNMHPASEPIQPWLTILSNGPAEAQP